MKRAKRANVSVEQRILILKRHLLEKVPISDLCQEHNIRPTTFYRWQKVFFENGHLAFADKHANADLRQNEDKIAALEAKLLLKNDVMAELLEEYTKLKKTLGGL